MNGSAQLPGSAKPAAGAGPLGDGEPMLRASGRWAWVLGWAVPREWFCRIVAAHLPRTEVRCFGATPRLWDELEREGPFDVIAGYSLGSLLLLSEPERAGRVAKAVALLAPIWAFLAEDAAGGRVSRAGLRALRRSLARSPDAALSGFYATAGLDLAPGQLAPTERGFLGWGLDELEQRRLTPRLSPGWRAWCGTDDPLIDSLRVLELVPSLTLVEAAGHAPGPLLGALARGSR